MKRMKLGESFRKFAQDVGGALSSLARGELTISERMISKHLEDFRMSLMESDVAYDVAEEIIEGIKRELIGGRKGIGESTHKIVEDSLRKILLKILEPSRIDFDRMVEEMEKPINIVFVGVNGTGKTSTIAKIGKRLIDMGYSVVFASADTFRAGAEEQIDEHASKLGVRVIKHRYGADPAAVIYDAVSHARARGIDFVLSDTAGRSHTNVNLMDQLSKICRVTKPQLVIFVDDATVGNDAVERARRFNSALNISGCVLTRFDLDVKGGTAISISSCIRKPIFFITKGQRYTDIEKFDPDGYVRRIMS